MSVDMLADISTDMSVEMSVEMCRSSIGRYFGLYVDRCLTDIMSVNTAADTWPIRCLLIIGPLSVVYRSTVGGLKFRLSVSIV